MSAKTYITARPLNWDGRWMTPKALLAHSFAGMGLEWRQLVWEPSRDGRMLIELVADTDPHLDAVVEAMAWFGAHQKTLGSARAFAEDVTGIAWELIGDPGSERCASDEGLRVPG